MPDQTIRSTYAALDSIMNRAASMDMDARQFSHTLATKSRPPILQPYEIAMYAVLVILAVVIVVVITTTY